MCQTVSNMFSKLKNSQAFNIFDNLLPSRAVNQPVTTNACKIKGGFFGSQNKARSVTRVLPDGINSKHLLSSDID